MTEHEAIRELKVGYLGDTKEIVQAKHMGIKALEKHIPKKAEHIQGNPLWGYCPSCGKPISKGGSPVGCKWCLQRVDWRNEDAE